MTVRRRVKPDPQSRGILHSCTQCGYGIKSDEVLHLDGALMQCPSCRSAFPCTGRERREAPAPLRTA